MLVLELGIPAESKAPCPGLDGKDTIQAKLEEVMKKRATVGKLCTPKTNFLNLNYLYAKFIQDANEEMTWMEEKKRKLVVESKAKTRLQTQART